MTSPTATELADACHRAGRSDLDAALHLALPVAVPCSAVTIHPDRLSWRDVSVSRSDDTAADAAALIAAGAEVGDRFLDLDGPPASWVKLLASGTRLVVCGPAELFGGPRIVADAGVERDEVETVVDLLRNGAALPLLVDSPHGPLLVDGDQRTRVWIRREQTSVAAAAEMSFNPAALTHRVVRGLGGRLEDFTLQSVSTGGAACAEIVVGTAEWSAHVSVLVDKTGGAVVGTAPVAVRWGTPQPMPEGWCWHGVDADGEIIAQHQRSGWFARLRRS
jgi:hypothetical protein